jgi:DNA-directed RNA polymerase subunit beta'
MRTFHTGGVAGVSDITGGFARLKQLIDATNP